MPAAVATLTLAACSQAAPPVGVGTSRDGTRVVASPAPATSSPRAAQTPAPSRSAARRLPTEAQLQAARAEVARLPIRTLAGQVIVSRYAGTSPTGAAELIRRHHLGGVAVFSGNIPSRPAAVAPALRAMAQQVQQAMKDDGRDWPAIIGIDQEGGPVERLGRPVTSLPAGMAFGAVKDAGLVTAATRSAGKELRGLGLTMVFAPDLDLTIGPKDPTIAVRSVGSDPGRASATARAMLDGYAAAGVLTTAKHFPGHGSVTTDSHHGLPVQRASAARLRARDWVPFKAAIDAGAPALMAAHILVPAIDKQLPATLSRPLLTGVLREQLGFKGVIVTDALEMGAVADRWGSARAAVLALNAGADVLLMPADTPAAIEGIVAAVGSGALPRARLIDAAARSVAMSRHARADAGGSPPGSAGKAVKAMTDASVTQVSGPCGAPLVKGAVTVSGGTPPLRQRFVQAARAAGLRIGGGTTVTLVGGGQYSAGGADSGPSTGSGHVVVAVDTPYGLARSQASVAKLALYGRDASSFASLVEVLEGRRKAVGTLPVPVGALPLGAGCRP
jgi:beta-N-acetylhexosaminidase